MTLLFNLSYNTVYGEEILLNIMSGDNASTVEQFKMSTQDGVSWSCSVNSLAKPGNVVNYFYSVAKNGVEVRREWLVEPHRLILTSVKGVNYIVNDNWIDIPEDSYLYSSAVTECVAARKKATPKSVDYSKTLKLKVRAPQLRGNERLAILGEIAELGQWEALKAYPMVEQ